MEQTLLIIIIGLLLLVIILIITFRYKGDTFDALNKLEGGIREDFRINREENARISRDNRTELSNTLKDFTLDEREKFAALRQEQKELTIRTVDQLDKISSKVEEKLGMLNEQAKKDSHLLREAINNTFKSFQETFDKNMQGFSNLQREKFGQLEEKQNKLVESTEKRLEEMRATVDEKLQKTLNERLGQSFELVSKQLESVQKGLGEMQTMATDVGGLKKVLSNVKLRGGIGEVQLAMLLEQILAPTQYDANVRTKKGSADPVEFAIKLPGRSEDENSVVYLPIDAKFPKDTYEQLITAYDRGLPEEIEISTRNLEITIKKMARAIRDKYIDPPYTTDFAIMFLPFESIYAEVIRRSSLVDQLRDEFKITVAGPTTLVAILNSLQMGFRTLSLQKRSSEVWKVLGAVKTEFEKFGGLLQKAKTNLDKASDTVDELLGKRTRAIDRTLRQVEALPAVETNQLLPDIDTIDEE
ncbi:DNA recombination protein RmuC [bacterium A37T11]|nr:DNA recombination protein RmuC [bacterium A37T11]